MKVYSGLILTVKVVMTASVDREELDGSHSHTGLARLKSVSKVSHFVRLWAKETATARPLKM